MLERSFEIFIQAIIPLLKVSPDDFGMIEEDPQEFVHGSADLCERRESANIKTASAELLLAIGSNVDGMFTFIVDFCVEFLQKVVQKSNTESQQYVQNLIEKFQLKFSSEEQIIEVCLLVLLILSPSIAERIDL